jgi:hypothetical protein
VMGMSFLSRSRSGPFLLISRGLARSSSRLNEEFTNAWNVKYLSINVYEARTFLCVEVTAHTRDLQSTQ